MKQANRLKTTPLGRWHLAHGAELDAGLVMSFPQSHQLGITDLTALERLGFKGADTVQWITDMGWPLPTSPNRALVHEGVVILRLSQTEFFMAAITAEGGEALKALRQHWSMELSERTYLLEREHSHACFAITGAHTSEMLAKLCAVDMRDHRFEPLSIAQTSVARTTGILTRLHHDGEPFFLLCSDMTSSEYLWRCLLDAMHEFSGGPLAYPQFLERLP